MLNQLPGFFFNSGYGCPIEGWWRWERSKWLSPVFTFPPPSLWCRAILFIWGEEYWPRSQRCTGNNWRFLFQPTRNELQNNTSYVIPGPTTSTELQWQYILCNSCYRHPDISTQFTIHLLTYLLNYLLTHSLTHSFTPWYRILFVKLIVTQLVKTNLAFFMEPKDPLPCSKKSITEPYPEPDESVPQSFLRSVLILSYYLNLCLKISLFPSVFFFTETVYSFISPARATSLTYLLLEFFTQIFGESSLQFMKPVVT